MAINVCWVGESDLDRVAQTRLRCYARAASELADFQSRTRNDPRSKAGDYLLAVVDGQDVGTSTSISFKMWVRGGCIPCQGVAWVGAIKTMRRKGASSTPGIASAVMRETIRMGRERGDVVSALMPFRASYYEHFGYGIVERRCDWTIPVSILPRGEFDSIRFFEPADFSARSECFLRVNQRGQCDIERSDAYWKNIDTAAEDGFAIVDRKADGPVRGYLRFLHQKNDGKDLVKVTESFAEDIDALRRQLHFLASLKDQFAAVEITLPADLPVNRLLTEPQIPHRPVNHDVPESKPYTRMQVRILDHARFLQSLRLPTEARGQSVVAVHECEGHQSRFNLQIDAGKISCSPSAQAPIFECNDRTWAAIACGDLKATDALRYGLAKGENAQILNVLAEGAVPFCNEYF